MPAIRKWSARSASCRPGAVTLIETVEQTQDVCAEECRTISPSSPRRRCRSTTRRTIVAIAEGALPRTSRPAQGRHLLRHHQPPARGEEGGAGGRCDDRGRLAELVQLAAPARSRRARGLPARGAGATAPPISTGRCSRASPGSASPQARRRRKCSSRRSWTRSPRNTRCMWRRSAAAEDERFFPLPRPLRPATAAE